MGFLYELAPKAAKVTATKTTTATAIATAVTTKAILIDI
jgi:hypothetical protein